MYTIHLYPLVNSLGSTGQFTPTGTQMVERCTKHNFMIVGKRFVLKKRRVVGVGGDKNVCLV